MPSLTHFEKDSVWKRLYRSIKRQNRNKSNIIDWKTLDTYVRMTPDVTFLAGTDLNRIISKLAYHEYLYIIDSEHFKVL